MKKMMLSLMLMFPAVSRAAYFQPIWTTPSHPLTAVTFMYTSKGMFDGAVADFAVAPHKGDVNDSILPRRWLDAGLQPISWSLLDLGVGGNTQSAFLKVGPSIDLTQNLLGPISALLIKAGGNYATFGKLMTSPTGNGLKLGVAWKVNVWNNGGVPKFDQLSAPIRYCFGANYQW